MDADPSTVSEELIRHACDTNDVRTAASLALRLYHAEIASFLAWRLRSPSDGHEAFSMFAEDLWAGLSSFEWRCSLRVWMYALARNAATRYATSPHMRFERRLIGDAQDQLSEILETVRTQTRVYQRTDMKNRVRALRDKLDPDDQMLLVLRVDRGLSWRDLALAVSGNADLDEESLKRESARLRQCFQRIKEELRRLAREQGLLSQTS
jgi:RNA polymerase sigma-70 factor (ECF subfamily)